MVRRLRKRFGRYLIDDARGVAWRAWSVWVAGFWGAAGAVIVVLSALLYQRFDWRIGALLIAVSASFAIARFLKQPGTES
jgi:hypothetical protein